MELLLSILSDLGVFGPAIGYTLGMALFEVINNFMKSIISPILDYFIGNNISTYIVNIGNFKFKIGLLIESLINFFLIFGVILFTLRVILKDIVKAVIKKKSENERKTANLLEQIVTWRLPLKPGVEY